MHSNSPSTIVSTENGARRQSSGILPITTATVFPTQDDQALPAILHFQDTGAVNFDSTAVQKAVIANLLNKGLGVSSRISLFLFYELEENLKEFIIILIKIT
jgi:hypothetical protein